MKRFFLFVMIIVTAFASGALGAYGVLYFQLHEKLDTAEKIQITTPTSSQNTENISLDDMQNSIIDIAQSVSPSVVSIIIKKDLVVYRSDPWGFFQQPTGTIERQVGGGSGFFIRKDGVILTNKHVVSDNTAAYTVILNDGKEYDATLLGTDPINDLALIKITDSEREFVPLDLIEQTGQIQIGEFAIAVGNALAEFQNSVSLGIISGKDRHIDAGQESLSGLIQTDAAINPGNSGGPLIDIDGNVMGVNTAIAAGSNGVGFSIALTEQKIAYMIESLKKYGRIKRPFIGINYIPNSAGVAQELGLGIDYGAYIIDEPDSIVEGSSAQSAGLEPGDIITGVDGQKISLDNSLGDILQNAIPGEILSLEVLKKSGTPEIVELTLGEY